MSNPYTDYYQEQAGSGLQGFEGVKLQRGHGFFGRVLHRAIIPLLKFLGKQALHTGINIGSDVIENKQSWRRAAKTRAKETGQNILMAGLKRARKYQQTGEGRRRKRRRTTKSIKRRTVKRPHQNRRRRRRGGRRRRTTKSALEKLMQNY
jgi:hypothetical protein